MSINIQRETSGKTMDIRDTNTDSFNASISRNNNSNDDLGLSYFTEEKGVPKENFDEESDLISNQADSDPGNSNEYSYAGEDEPRDTYIQGISFEEEQSLRANYLVQLKNLYKRGYVSDRRFGPEDSSSVLKCEVLRLKREKSIESGVNYCKQGLVFFASTIEMVNKNVLNSPAKLDGFGGHILATQEDYNEVFEELYVKYAGTLEVGPEIKFLTLFASSVFMFHLSKVTAENIALSKKAEMSGPSEESEKLLQKLSSGNYSDLSSIDSEDDKPIKPKRTYNKKSKK